jgi:Zn-dependent protease with chaperone function
MTLQLSLRALRLPTAAYRSGIQQSMKSQPTAPLRDHGRIESISEGDGLSQSHRILTLYAKALSPARKPTSPEQREAERLLRELLKVAPRGTKSRLKKGVRVLDSTPLSTSPAFYVNWYGGGIVINQQNFQRWSPITRQFVIAHELGHAANQLPEQNPFEREYNADLLGASMIRKLGVESSLLPVFQELDRMSAAKRRRFLAEPFKARVNSMQQFSPEGNSLTHPSAASRWLKLVEAGLDPM